MPTEGKNFLQSTGLAEASFVVAATGVFAGAASSVEATEIEEFSLRAVLASTLVSTLACSVTGVTATLATEEFSLFARFATGSASAVSTCCLTTGSLLTMRFLAGARSRSAT